MSHPKQKYWVLLRWVLGKRVLIWSSISISASLVQGLVELGMSGFLQFFLAALGILSQELKLPFGIPTPQLSIFTLILMLTGFGIIRCINQFLVGYCASIANEEIVGRLRNICLAKMLHPEKGSYLSSSRAMHLMSEIFVRSSNLFHYASLSLSHGITAIAVAAIMFSLAWKEALLGFAGLGVLALAMIFVNRGINKHAQGVVKEFAELSNGIERIARNWLLIKILRTEPLEFEKTVTNVRHYQRIANATSFYAHLSNALPIAFGTALVGIIIYFSRQFWETDGLILVSFLYLFLRFVQTLAQTAQELAYLKIFRPQLMETNQFLSTCEEDILKLAGTRLENFKTLASNSTDFLVENHANYKPQTPPPSIEIRGLEYQYPGEGNPILKFPDFKIKAGSMVGIQGESGSGKSTLLLLTVGVLSPSNQGKVLIENEDAKQFFKRNSRSIGYVGAEAFLTEGSIRENIIYGLEQKSITDREIYEALELAQLKKVVENLPGNLSYKIRADGAGLSAGQKQRLALARALLRKPSLLIMDEATANLDLKTESEIMDALNQLKHHLTILVVSHRPQTLEGVAQIITLKI